MKTTQKLPHGCASLSNPISSLRAWWTNVVSWMSNQQSWSDTVSATSLQESVDGLTLCGSPECPTTSPSGREAARASRSAKTDIDGALQMNGTCGQHSLISSASAALQRSLASRLRTKMGVNGSMEYSLTWKARTIGQREPICVLLGLVPRTSDNGFTGWQTLTSSLSSTGRKISDALNLQGECGSNSKPINASIQKRGAVHPKHLCWLMGYPFQWVSCGDLAMRSFRKSPKSSSAPTTMSDPAFN